jgi:hypothetical protein
VFSVGLLALTLATASAAEPARITEVNVPAAGIYDRTLVLYFTLNFSAPVAVSSPIAVQTSSAPPRLPSVRIIVAGARKMPAPTTWLMTMAVAVQVPSRRADDVLRR